MAKKEVFSRKKLDMFNWGSQFVQSYSAHLLLNAGEGEFSANKIETNLSQERRH